jgi:DNA-binding CsgD family transcriptional regulator/tetratricopeptide (TPR) repeat protein
VELLERDCHLAILGDRLAEVRASRRGQLVMLGGEAGVGKTAIVRAFGERQRSVGVLAGGCEALFTPRPLGPLVDIADEVGGELAEVTERGASAGEVLAALSRAIRDASVVVLEDLHWADEATLDVVQLLGRRVERMPALVIATYRDDELERDHPLRLVLGDLTTAHRVSVEPLSPDAVARLAAAHGVDGAALHARTGGNPFYVTEVLAREGPGTPGSVRDAVLARAARLSAPARRLLEAVAVARPRAEIWLLERIAADELGELEACLASGMLRAEGEAVGFRHEIARATIEDELSPDRQLALHRAALAALVGRAEPARLAHHAAAAGDGAAVLEHSQAAGERAARLGAHREAAAHYAAALEHADGLEPAARAALLELRAQESFVSGAVQEAIEAETSALEIFVATGDRLREGGAHRSLGTFAWYQGDGPRVKAETDTAVEILETLPPGRELALAYGRQASGSMMEFDLAGAREWGAKAIALAERLGETETLVGATGVVGTVELHHGLAEGREKVTWSLQSALEAGLDRHAAVDYCNLVAGSHHLRDYETVAAHLAPGRAFCDEHDLLAWDLYLGGWEAHVALDHGRWAEAAAVAGEVLERTRGTLPHSRYRALIVAGLVHARRGDADPWPELDEALEIAVEADELDTIHPVAVGRAEARWLTGEAGLVAEETDEAIARAEPTGSPTLIGELALWRHRAGLPYAGNVRLLFPYQAEIAGDVVAAAEFWRARGCRYDAAVALAGSQGEDDLRESLRELQRLGARPAAAIVARRLRERGVRGVQRGPRTSTRANPAGLTDRQLEVLALIVNGLSNADIAERLVISHKTAEHHVSAVLSKLGVSGRHAAARRAAELGLVDAPGNGAAAASS